MNNVIILEGPDNIGKSYLANIFKQKYKGLLIHYGPNKTKAGGKKVFFDFIDTCAQAKNKNFILDRSPFGEFVYGKIFRKYDPFTYWDKAVKALRDLKNTRIFFIVLYTDEYAYNIHGLMPKGDEKEVYQKIEQSDLVSCAFIDVANKLGGIPNIERYVVNTTNYSSLDDRNDYVVEAVDMFMKQRFRSILNVNGYSHTIFNPSQLQYDSVLKVLATSNICCGEYKRESCELGRQHKESKYGIKWKRPTDCVGNIENPKYIFVGEAPGRLGCGTWGIAFYGDKSGNLFRDALVQCNILETECLIFNTIRCCSKDNKLGEYYDAENRLKLECVKQLRSELCNYTSSKIIALGNVASTTLKALRIEHEKIYHPAYYLRIGHARKFIEELRKVV